MKPALRQALQRLLEEPGFIAYHSSPRAGLRRLDARKSGMIQSHGRGVYLTTEPQRDFGANQYAVRVRGSLSDFPSHWEPIGERHAATYEALFPRGRRREITPDLFHSAAYQRLANAMPGLGYKQRELRASRALSEAGIPGLRANVTRSQLVVFNDRDTQILRRALLEALAAEGRL